MRLFGRYLFRHTAGALLLILLSLTGVVWIATALKQLNVVTSQGHEAVLFLKLTMLAIPNLMAIIAPVALLIAALHALNKLNGDSELIVMAASGATVWYFARPLVLLAAIVSGAVLVTNLYVMPWSARSLAEMIVKLRTDLIGQVIQPGRFSSPEKGLTFHIRERDSRTGQIRGLLMHDDRDEGQSTSYLAERGDIVKEGPDAFLIMHDGRFIRSSIAEPTPRIIRFDRYVIDLVRFKPKDEQAILRPRERYLYELWSPSAKDLADRATAGKIRSELHERLASPLYPFAFVLIVLAAVGVAQTTRQNRVKSIALAFVLAAGVRIGGFAAANLVALQPKAVPLVYALPTGAMVIAGLWAALRMRPRRRSALAARIEAAVDAVREQLVGRFASARRGSARPA